jgi:hypothetical protein
MATDLLEPIPAASDFAAHAASEAVADRIEVARNQVALVRTLARRLWSATIALVLLGALTWLDYRFELAWGVRAIGLLAVAAAVGYLAFSLLRRLFPEYRLANAAADVETALPAFGQRLRTTVDYLRADQPAAPAAPELLRAFGADTHRLARHADFSEVVSIRPVAIAGAAAAIVVFAWLGGLAASSEWRIATTRAMLFPRHYTTVTFLPSQDQTIRAGESIEVVANIEGRPIDAATVQFRATGETSWESLELLPPGERSKKETAKKADTADLAPSALLGKVSATLLHCRTDFDFKVVAGPSELAPVHVRVLQPLTIASFSANVTPPEYTRKPAEAVKEWNVKALEGSNIQLDVELSRAAVTAELKPVASSKSNATSKAVPLQLEGNHLRGALRDLRSSEKWELTARTADGIDLKPQRLSIRVLADGRAKLRFVEPDEELEVIATAEVPMVVEAEDDLSLLRVGIAAQVGEGPLKTIWEQEITGGTTEAIRGETVLPLEDYKLTFQDSVTYHAFADDQYFDDVRRTTTPLRFIDIRPFKLSFQMLDTGGT